MLKILGKGGFSEVWLADDTWTSTRVALKFYAPGTGLDDEGIQLFTHEFALLSDLNHSNLLKPSHYDHYEKMPFLVLTYCENGSALKLINRVNEEKVWHFIQDVSAGLHYLHSCDPPIIHQDIKPDNILIDRSGRFVITDFGISTRVRNTLRKSGISGYTTGGGTWAYMAPERFGSDPEPVKASDVYSLGATVFELLTGYVPFGEHGGLLQKNGADIPKIKGDYSPMLKEIVYKCLAMNTWERLTAFELSNYAESMLRGKTIIIKEKVRPKGDDGGGSDGSNKLIIGLIAGVSAIVLMVATFFIVYKFPGDVNVKRSNVISLYNHYIHQGDSLNDAGRKDDTNFEVIYVDALENYQKALYTAKDLDDDLLMNDAQKKIDDMKKVILTAYEEFLFKAEKMKEYNALPAAEAFSERANYLKEFVDKEHNSK
ncbi:MAG: serine/threonine protein kinase [Tannerella sp.]|nr:serine/threonine protein kinase [Tannerella sp.]